MKCEAKQLALEGYGDDECPECDETASVAIADRWLCRGCADALGRLTGLARLLLVRGALDGGSK